MKFGKVKGLLAALLLVSVTAVYAAEAPKTLPRKETLYLGGLIWGAPQNFNPLSTQSSYPIQSQYGYLLVYETLFMYNQLSNANEPLLGKSFEWTDANTLKVVLNKGTKFNDGKPLTADDVAYSYMLGKKYAAPWSATLNYIDEVVAQGPETVLIKMSTAKPNRLFVLDSLSKVYVIPKHVWTAIEEKAGNDITKILQEFNPDPVASGPYKIIFYDETRVVLQRDDNYWGKSIFGKLPAPKYVAHLIYKSNDASSNAFRQGEIDVNQQFIPKVWTLWEKKAPFKTYLSEAPYYVPALIPSLYFNMTKKGIGDTADVRRALAMAIDYKKIADVAMSGYSAAMVPGFILQVPGEKAMVDESKIKSLMYKNDADAANKLLDSIGAAKGADGIRVLKDGTRLGPWEVSCPYGWSDWNASLEIVVQSAKKIGMELRTKFPEFPVWYNDVKNGNFDIAMWNTSQPGVAQPWDRVRAYLDSTGAPPVGQPVTATFNYGRYSNPRADAIIAAIPKETDPVKQKALYTELSQIFLTDLPQVGLMYRPGTFYTVYEGVWKGFPDAKNNPKNIPPMAVRGAFHKVLYNITAK